ncbi:Aste57867_20417 [Aphanomyces stellatus]|uniref:Aste57867_20417 protein n=1 Tax=Aphanomyces stellatus TaxID=120398 RepID=A0A485LEW9_9STRA|nr:hypothetical protein As57867_020351 [Aphanomyces stellatus]VFT97103.1 Aste57867_20417 [Aphanomyces stellatus]
MSVKYGSFRDEMETTTGAMPQRVKRGYYCITGVVMCGIVLLQLGFDWRNGWPTPVGDITSSRDDLSAVPSSALINAFLSHMDQQARRDDEHDVASVDAIAASLRASGFDTTTSPYEYVAMTPSQYTLSLLRDGVVLETLSLVPSRLDRCSKDLNVLASIVPWADASLSVPSPAESLEGKIALIPIRSTDENCGALALASKHRMAMALFHATGDHVDTNDSAIVCSSYEGDLELTPGYTATHGMPRLSIAAAERRQGWTMPAARIAFASAAKILALIKPIGASDSAEDDAPPQVRLRVLRQCHVNVHELWMVEGVVAGASNEMVVLGAGRAKTLATDPIVALAPALRELLNQGWIPACSMKLVSWASPGIAATDTTSDALHVTLNVQGGYLAKSTSLPLHASLVDTMWTRVSASTGTDVSWTAAGQGTSTAASLDIRALPPASREAVNLWGLLGVHAATDPRAFGRPVVDGFLGAVRTLEVGLPCADLVERADSLSLRHSFVSLASLDASLARLEAASRRSDATRAAANDACAALAAAILHQP